MSSRPYRPPVRVTRAAFGLAVAGSLACTVVTEIDEPCQGAANNVRLDDGRCVCAAEHARCDPDDPELLDCCPIDA